jgi:hypothetical protein
MRLTLTLLLALAATASGATGQYDDLVVRFYPVELTTLRGEPVAAARKISRYVTGDLTGDGNVLIVAAYTNGIKAGVRVLTPKSGGQVLATVVPPTMTGRDVSVALRDLDGDKKPEIIVGLRDSRGIETDWLYGFTGNALKFLGPASTEDANTSELTDISFVDLDGDGQVEVIDSKAARVYDATADDDVYSHTYDVYALKDGQLKAEGVSARYFRTFYRAKGEPQWDADSISTTKSQAGELLIANGNEGSDTVSSADITWNGVMVAGASNFNSNVHRLTVPVAILTENTLRVKIAGKPGACLHLLLTMKQE